jgi:hypothetical protein
MAADRRRDRGGREWVGCIFHVDFPFNSDLTCDGGKGGMEDGKLMKGKERTVDVETRDRTR